MSVLDSAGSSACSRHTAPPTTSYINTEAVHLRRHFNATSERWCMRAWGVDVADLMVSMIAPANITTDPLFLLLCGLAVVSRFGDDFFASIAQNWQACLQAMMSWQAPQASWRCLVASHKVWRRGRSLHPVLYNPHGATQFCFSHLWLKKWSLFCEGSIPTLRLHRSIAVLANLCDYVLQTVNEKYADIFFPLCVCVCVM